MREVIFWGATGQAKVLRECLGDTARLTALFDNDTHVAPPFVDVPLIRGRAGFEAWLQGRAGALEMYFLVAIGGDKGQARLEIQEYLESQGLKPLTAIHRTAFVAHNVKLGEGSQILAQSAVCVDAQIGRACIVNTGASVDHDCIVDDGVHIAPGARMAGCVKVARFAMIGTGAVVLPRLTIGEGAVVGAGAVVTRDVQPYTMVAGNPARLLRTIK